ncbi:MAG: ATP-binding cassette domain-containing protein [Bacillota bacterium]
MKTLKLIGRMIAYRPWLYLANAIFWTAIHTLPVLPGLITRHFFNTLTSEATGFNIWTIIAMLVAVAIGRITTIVFGALTDSKHRFTMSALLRNNLLQGIFRRPGAAALPCSPGEAVSYFREDAEQVEDVISWTVDMIGEIVFASTAVVVLVRINPTITLFVFLPLVAVMVIFQKATQKIEAYRQASREATTEVTGFVGEVFGAVQAVQVARAEGRTVEHLKRLNDRRRQLILKDRAFSLLLDSVSSNTVSLGTGMILILASQAIRAGTFSIGDFALFVYYLDFVTGFSEFCGYFMAHLKQTTVAFNRMMELLPGNSHDRLVDPNPLYLDGQLPEVSETAPHDDRLRELRVSGLSYSYPGSDKGIRGINFSIGQGEFVVITGRIGSGKTTLLRTVLGLVARDGGTITWNDRTVDSPADFLVPPRVAFTAQIPVLFSDTVEGNVLLGQPKEKVDLADAIHTAVLEPDLDSLEQGLESMVGSRGVKLSGGQVQRVAAARMFARAADLMVFDDLSSALDVETERLMWERVFAKRSATCLVVSHRRSALRRADHIIVLKEGQIADEGKLDELLERCEEMRLLMHGDACHEGQNQALAAQLQTANASNQ